MPILFFLERVQKSRSPGNRGWVGEEDGSWVRKSSGVCSLPTYVSVRIKLVFGAREDVFF